MNEEQDAGGRVQRVQEDVQAFTMTVDEAAAALGKSPDTVRRFIRAGTLPSVRVQGSRTVEYRLRPEDVQDVQIGMPTYASTHVGMHAADARLHDSADGESTRPAGAGAAPAARVDVAAGLQAIVAPLVAELAAARQAIERLATENGRLQAEVERLRALDAAPSPQLAALRDRLAALETESTRLDALTQDLALEHDEEVDQAQQIIVLQEQVAQLTNHHGAAGQESDAGAATATGDLWAQLAAKAAAVPDAVTQAFEVLEATRVQPEDPTRRGLLARLFRRHSG